MKRYLHILRPAVLIVGVSLVIAAGVGIVLYANSINYERVATHLASKSVLTPELCLSFESFDTSEGACKPACSFDGQCPVIENNYRKILDVLSLDDLKLYFAFDEAPFKDAFGTNAEARYQTPVDPNSVQNRSYSVVDGHLSKEISHTGEPVFARSPEKLWSLFKVAIPTRDEKYIDQFLILHDFNGALDAAAWVIQDATTTWQVAVNEGIAFSPHGYLIDRGNVVHTLIHEVGHLITLNPDQVDAGAASSSCRTIVLPEGCPRHNSYFAAFVRDFWPNEVGGVEVPSGEYRAGEFVSGYAADNPAEDMAETWTAFVLFPKPKGVSVAEKKILFFYRYPELVASREAIRSKIGTIR